MKLLLAAAAGFVAAVGVALAVWSRRRPVQTLDLSEVVEAAEVEFEER